MDEGNAARLSTNFRFHFFLAIIAALMMALLWPGLDAVAQESPTPVKIGVLAKLGPERCLEKWVPMATYLTNEIPGYSFSIVPLGYDAIHAAVERKKVDFILADPFFYVEMEMRHGASCIATLINVENGEERLVFGAAIFYKADRTDIVGLTDLKGKTFMAVAETSLGGWLAGWRELKEHGIDPHRDFADLRFGGTHDAVVHAVRDGKVDAGTVRTDTLERMAMEGKIRLEDFRVIHKHGGGMVHLPFLHSTRAYPEWPMAQLKHTSDDLAKKVAVTLLKMPPDSAAARAARSAGWTIPLNYQPVHECLKELRVGPYKDYGKVTPGAVLRQYWPWFMAALFFTACILLFTLYVIRLNRKFRKAVQAERRELAERKRAEEALRRSNYELGERLKELSCLYAVSRLAEKHDSLETIMQGTVEIIPPAWQYPEITCARITLEDQVYNTGNFKETAWKQAADIIVRGDTIGVLEVCYLEKRPEADEGPFFREERDLINSLAERLGKTIERVRAEERLKVFQKALEASSDAIGMSTPEGKHVYQNEAFTEMFGKNVDEVQAETGPPETLYADEAVGREVFETIMRGDSWTGEVRMLGKNKKLPNIFLRAYAIKDQKGNVSQLVGVHSDITDRKRAAEALKESESQFRDLFELSPQAIALTEVDSGKLVRVNRKFLELTKYSMDEIVGRTTTEVEFYPEKDRERFKSELLSSGNVSGMVMEFKTKDNSTLNVLMFATVIPIEGKPHILTMFQDVTEQRNIETQLRHQQKLESIGTLASGVAHEINNPITSILNFAELIQMRTKEDERLADYTGRIISETNRVARIVKNLLSFARQGKESHSPAFMADIVNDTLGLIAAVFRKDQIDVAVDVRDDLPRIRCRSQQIQQVLMNLFTNARDALNERYPEFDENKILKITCALFEKEGEKWIRTTVENHGGAIPPEVMDRIFDPFFTTKPRDLGTGLGLSISYGIVKEHQGELSVESDENSTRFHLDLPVNNGWTLENRDSSE